jgi:hypothetical protein
MGKWRGVVLIAIKLECEAIPDTRNSASDDTSKITPFTQESPSAYQWSAPGFHFGSLGDHPVQWS